MNSEVFWSQRRHRKDAGVVLFIRLAVNVVTILL